MNPQSRIWLCKSNLENDYKNTLTFSSKNAQRNYFIGDPSDPTDAGISTKSYSEYTYLRLEQAIKVDDLIDNIDTNNYLVLINNNKYYYYFITTMDYVDEETTKIHIELDVMQTYFFDIEYKQTFVEREHVTDDTAGKHTIPEGLETGEIIGGDPITISYQTGATSNIVFQVIYDDTLPNLNFQYGGVFSGTCYMIFDIPNAIKYIKYMDSLARKDYIVNIFMYYGNIESATDYYIPDTEYGDIDFKLVNPTSSAQQDLEIEILASKPTKVGTYTPRNKKLLTYPYCYLLADNKAGTTKVYRYEDFLTSSIKFTRYSVVCPGGSTLYYPWNYQGSSESVNFLEGFVGAKFPMCSWASDGYTNWLTQSSVNREYNYKKDTGQVFLGAGMTAFGAMTGFTPLTFMGAGMMAQGTGEAVGDVIQNMQAKQEHQIAPMELQGFANAGDVVYSQFKSLPTFTLMYIKPEFASVLDKFFDQFGYQVNILKTPSIHTRSNWNYLKTKSCNFTGDIPQEYMSRIKSIFDKGITFWHKPQYMFDYTQTNNVI